MRSRSIVVWFDEWEIHVGDSITQKIERGLDKADFVAVLLTKHSVSSGWVDKEWRPKIAEEAERRKVIILPLKAENCPIPVLLRDKKYANFLKDYTSGLDALLKAIEAHSKQKIPSLPSEVTLPVERIAELPIGGIPLPCFFPSVSGAAKNALSPLEHIEIINAVRYPHYLISAYDISHAGRDGRLKMQQLLEKSTSRGQIVLMDSGVYEKRWLHDKDWEPSDFHETLRNTPGHLAFCFDDPDAKGNADQIAGALE